MASHERERALAVAAVAGVLERCWAVREGLDGVDWAWLLARLDEHGLGALMFAEAERAGVLARLPADARDRLRRRAEDTAAANAQLLAAALRAGALLDAAGIPWMPMKGVALAIVAPEYFATRVTSDIDVIVPPSDLERAAAALGKALDTARVATDFEGERLGVASAGPRHEHHLHTFATSSGIAIELHHLFPGMTEDESSAVWSRAALRTIGRARVLVPALEDLLGISCVHALIVHDIETQIALRHVADTRVFTEFGVDGEAARSRYDVRGRAAVARSLDRVSACLAHAAVRESGPCEAAELIEPGALHRARALGSRLRWMASRATARLRDNGGRALFPSRSFLVARYGPSAETDRIGVLWVRRWAEILLRAIKGR